MASKRYTPRKPFDLGLHLVRQKMGMARHFPCFTCSLRNRVLDCVGEITPSEGCQTYRISVRLVRDGTPVVRILEPNIEPNRKYHTYGDGQLCLYKPCEHPWKRSDFLHDKIIPWTAEWLVYYEIYLRTGKWEGPEADHGTTPKTPQTKASEAA